MIYGLKTSTSTLGIDTWSALDFVWTGNKTPHEEDLVLVGERLSRKYHPMVGQQENPHLLGTELSQGP
jgi:hypothetical protein